MASREDYAKYISTASLLVAVAFMIGGVQSSGAILDTCNQGGMGINSISYTQCRDIGTAITTMGSLEAAYLSLLLTIARVEAALFLGMGVGALYGLAFCKLPERTSLHLVHAVWATAVTAVHMHSAGWFGDFGMDPNVDGKIYEAYPILILLVVVQVVLYWAAFFGAARAKRDATVAKGERLSLGHDA